MARKSSRRRNSRRLRRNAEVSLTYGVVPSFEEFSTDISHTGFNDEDEPVSAWDEEEGYPMELVGSAVEQAEKALRKCNKKKGFHVAGFTGRHGKFGLRFTDKKSLWHFIKALPILTDDPDGDIASSIMTTLGYEWI